MHKHYVDRFLVLDCLIRTKAVNNRELSARMKSFLFRSIVLFPLFFLQQKSYCQAIDSVIIEGKITNNKEARLTLHTRDYFVLPQSYPVTINSNGSFQVKVPLQLSGSIDIVYKERMISLYVPQNKKLSLTWLGVNFFQSVRVNADDKLNAFLIHYQQNFTESSSFLFEKAVTEKEQKGYLRIVDSLNEEEFTFLKKHGGSLDEVSFQKVAYDIFYANLFKIMNSPLMKGYSFAIKSSGEDVAGGFPFITLLDKKFDSLKATFVIELKKKNPNLDSLVLDKYAGIQAKQIFKNQYSVMDADALELSRGYRYFLNDYFLSLTFEIYYRNFGKSQLSSITDFAALVHAVIKNDVIADWLIGQKIHGYIVYNASKLEQSAFDQQLVSLNSKSAKDQLTTTYKFYRSLQPGNPAPPFSVTNENGEPVSLSQFRGKFVFIDFWESICAPCISEITNHSASVAKKYKDSNVVFLYISLDAEEKDWKKSVAKYKPKGLNLHASFGWNNAVVQQYGIFAVPRSIIIAPDGTIRDAQGPRLYQLLESNFFR